MKKFLSYDKINLFFLIGSAIGSIIIIIIFLANHNSVKNSSLWEMLLILIITFLSSLVDYIKK